MKTHYIALVLISLLFFNCDSGSSSSDDDFLNGSNYLSENNLYIAYLTSEIEEVDTEIDSLQTVIDDMTGDANTLIHLNDAIAERDNLVLDRDDAYLVGNPFPLDTSTSCPDPVTCFSSSADYFVVPNAYYDFEIFVLNDQSDIILDTADVSISDLPGVNDYKYQDMTIDGYVGPVSLYITKYNAEGAIISYSVEGYAY